MVDAAAHSYVSDSAVEPAIVALRQHVLDLVDSEIARVRSRGDDGRVEEALRTSQRVPAHSVDPWRGAMRPAGRADAVSEASRGAFPVWKRGRETGSSHGEDPPGRRASRAKT